MQTKYSDLSLEQEFYIHRMIAVKINQRTLQLLDTSSTSGRSPYWMEEITAADVHRTPVRVPIYFDGKLK